MNLKWAIFILVFDPIKTFFIQIISFETLSGIDL